MFNELASYRRYLSSKIRKHWAPVLIIVVLVLDAIATNKYAVGWVLGY